MTDDDNSFEQDYRSRYLTPDLIPQRALGEALRSLALFDTDRNLVSQAMNLTIVDEFIMGLEYEYLRARFNETSTPYDSVFLAAQSQMWIFSAYEVMRTWIQKAKGYVRTANNSGLQIKLADLKRDRGYTNFTALQKINEIQVLLDDPLMLERLQDDLARTHFLFIQVETIRVALAKHEVRKREGAMMAGGLVGYMNRECGSLSYDMNAGMVSTGEISRRDIADGIRSIPDLPVPTADEVKSYELFMRGVSDQEASELFKDFEVHPSGD